MMEERLAKKNKKNKNRGRVETYPALLFGMFAVSFCLFILDLCNKIFYHSLYATVLSGVILCKSAKSQEKADM